MSPYRTTPLVLVHPLALPSPMANGIQTLATAAALARTGRSVRLFVRAPADLDLGCHVREIYGIELPPGLNLEVVGSTKRSAGIRLRTRLAALLVARTPTVFLCRSLRHGVFLLRARRFLGRLAGPAYTKTIVQEFHNLEYRVAREAGNAKRAALLEQREDRIARGADGLLCISKPLAEDLRTAFSPAAPLEVIEDGVETQRFRGVARAQPSADRARIVYAGSFFPHKGVDSLVDAIALLPAGVELELVGGHPADAVASLRRRIDAEPKLQGRVHLVGAVPNREVPRALARADLIVLPAGPESAAQRYTSPLKLFEAMATGAPIVAAPSAAHASVLREGQTALLARDSTAESLAAAVRNALGDPARAIAIGRAAIEDAERYDWNRRASRIAAFVDTLGEN